MMIAAALPGPVTPPSAPAGSGVSPEWLAVFAATTASIPSGNPVLLADPVASGPLVATPDVDMPSVPPAGALLSIIVPVPVPRSCEARSAAAASFSSDVDGEHVATDVVAEDAIECPDDSALAALALLPVLSPIAPPITGEAATPPEPVLPGGTPAAIFAGRPASPRQSHTPDAPVAPAVHAAPRRREVGQQAPPDSPAERAVGIAKRAADTVVPASASGAPAATGTAQTTAVAQPALVAVVPPAMPAIDAVAWAAALPPTASTAPTTPAAPPVPSPTPVSAPGAARPDPARRIVTPGGTPLTGTNDAKRAGDEELRPLPMALLAAPAGATSSAATAAATPAADARVPVADPLPAPTAQMTADAMIVATDRLGAVRVAIEAADGLAVALSVDRGASATLLGAAVDRLDTALAASGQRLEALSVDVRGGDGGRRAPPPLPLVLIPPAPASAAPTPAARPRRDRYA